jgi:putative membrane protein
MAVASTVRLLASLFLAGLCLAAGPGGAEDAGVAAFIESGYSPAQFQSRISRVVAQKEVRPEAKALASAVLAYRERQIPAIAELAKTVGIGVRNTLDRESLAIAENLTPLDGLELSRRYLEVEIQALEKEAELYQEVARSGSESVRAFAQREVSTVKQMADTARSAYNAAKPGSGFNLASGLHRPQ